MRPPSHTTLPTLEDVARMSGVSTATVSRALNEPSLVRPETRERVRSAVERLGYTPHFGGRALASNRSNTMGAVIPTMENAIFAQGLQALQEELAAAGVTLLVATSNYDPAREVDQIRALLGRGIDGLVLIGEARDEAVYAMLEQRGVPYVLVWTWREGAPRLSVGFDNRAAARAMAELVLDQGHTRIAMIAGPTRYNDRATLRVEGVRAALEARGLSFAPGLLVECAYAFEAASVAAIGLMDRPDPPTAIVCGNDVIAAGAMKGLASRGLTVPGDVSVTGFDDIEIARLLTPELTTVHVPHRRMGQAAARLLLRLRLRGPEEEAESVCFRPEIMRRGSLGPPRGQAS